MQYKVVIIGGGNVAYHLIRNITSSGHQLVQIFNRSLQNINAFHSKTNIVGKIGELTMDADIYIVCVKDNAIEEVVSHLNLNDKLIVHTSGNRSMNLLKNCSTHFGVFYPLQSFTKNIDIKIKEVPIAIEANNDNAMDILNDFAQSISNRVVRMDEEQRKQLNIAGVFVNNFANHLYTLMSDYLAAHQIDFNLLLPLIHHTQEKLKLGNPKDMQTGPASRGDQNTIKDHLELLSGDEKLSNLYRLMTDNILSYYHNK
jgi:predicted short-subunit dehydrogenase-like oxidoreductase (DUF2520 family)